MTSLVPWATAATAPTTASSSSTTGSASLKERKDQNETVHVFEYDKLGRQTHDRVTSVGSGIDNAVLRLSRTYEVRGLVEKATSYDSATVGSGNVVNEVQFAYNDFGQLTSDYQSHGGAVDTGTTPKVAYTYANGSGNHIRRAKITYPNGRFLHIAYNSGDDGNLGRVSFLADDDSGSPGTHLAEYTYLGIGMVAKVDYTEPDLRCDLAHGSGDDPFDGLDRFDRVIDLLWRDYGSSVDVERVKHGYDRAGNRLWRECPVPAAQNPAVHMDELYTYDGIYQLKTFKRGDLNGNKDGIVNGTLKFAQEWTLDPTVNWTAFKEDADGDGTFELDQSRTHNKFNEITQIAGSSSHVAHDRTGNITTVPKPNNWSAHHDNVYDAWNRLVTVKDGSDKVIDNAYDALTRRTLKKVYAAGVLDYTRHYYYSDRWQVLEERKDTATRADRQFVWGVRHLDDLVLRDRDADGSSGTGSLGIASSGLEERLYCQQDWNWNLTAITDSAGDVQERCAYVAYGKPVFLSPSYGSRSASSFDWETLFAGYRWDPESSQYVVRQRHLSSWLGRWAQRDALGFRDGLNLYSYVHSNPISYHDPSGLACSGCRRPPVYHGGCTASHTLRMIDPSPHEKFKDLVVATVTGTIALVRGVCTGTAGDYRITVRIDAWGEEVVPGEPDPETGKPPDLRVQRCNSTTKGWIASVPEDPTLLVVTPALGLRCTKARVVLLPKTEWTAADCPALGVTVDCAIRCYATGRCGRRTSCERVRGALDITMAESKDRGQRLWVGIVLEPLSWWGCIIQRCRSAIRVYQY